MFVVLLVLYVQSVFIVRRMVVYSFIFTYSLIGWQIVHSWIFLKALSRIQEYVHARLRTQMVISYY